MVAQMQSGEAQEEELSRVYPSISGGYGFQGHQLPGDSPCRTHFLIFTFLSRYHALNPAETFQCKYSTRLVQMTKLSSITDNEKEHNLNKSMRGGIL